MIYVTNGYDTKEFDSSIQAYRYIAEDTGQHGLSVECIFDSKKDSIRVLVYQYSTLYLETYIVHSEIDLRKRGQINE